MRRQKALLSRKKFRSMSHKTVYLSGDVAAGRIGHFEGKVYDANSLLSEYQAILQISGNKGGPDKLLEKGSEPYYSGF